MHKFLAIVFTLSPRIKDHALESSSWWIRPSNIPYARQYQIYLKYYAKLQNDDRLASTS